MSGSWGHTSKRSKRKDVHGPWLPPVEVPHLRTCRPESAGGAFGPEFSAGAVPLPLGAPSRCWRWSCMCCCPRGTGISAWTAWSCRQHWPVCRWLPFNQQTRACLEDVVGHLFLLRCIQLYKVAEHKVSGFHQCRGMGQDHPCVIIPLPQSVDPSSIGYFTTLTLNFHHMKVLIQHLRMIRVSAHQNHLGSLVPPTQPMRVTVWINPDCRSCRHWRGWGWFFKNTPLPWTGPQMAAEYQNMDGSVVSFGQITFFLTCRPLWNHHRWLENHWKLSLWLWKRNREFEVKTAAVKCWQVTVANYRVG